MQSIAGFTRSIILVGILLLPTFTLAASNSSLATPYNKTEQLFNIKSALNKIADVQKEIAPNNKQLKEYNGYLNSIEELRDQAESCVEKSVTQLKVVNELLDSLQKIGEKPNVAKSEQYKFLQNKKDNYTQQAVDCKLFLFQSKDLANQLRNNIQTLTAQTKLKRAVPIWNVVSQSTKLLDGLDSSKLYAISGLKIFDNNFAKIFLGLILLALGIGIFIHFKIRQWIKNTTTQSQVSLAIMSTLRRYIVPLVLFTATSSYLAPLFLDKPDPIIAQISYLLCAYFYLIALLNFIFIPPKPAQPVVYKTNFGHAWFVRLTILISFLAICGGMILGLQNQSLNQQLTDITQSLFLLILTINVIWLSWLFASLPILKQRHNSFSIFIKVALVVILFAVTIIQALGYYKLASHVIFSLLFIVIALGLFYLLVRLINGVENFLNHIDSQASRTVRYHLGLKFGKRLTEFFFIKLAIYATASYGFILLLMRTFGASLNHIEKLNTAVTKGFVLVKMTIIPLQIVLALLFFGIVLLLGRWAASAISRRHKFQGEKDTQDAMASLFSYINFCFALIIAFVVAGIDLTGLAVIVGALSVGIGLGLQSIVNNFISGIILLIEKPIKPGDRVVINNKEGFIRRIRLRSTQITTLAKEDIIVPNSDLITHPVTNYTFSNEFARSSCNVGVAYSSDIDLVKKLLMEIALQHPDVSKNEADKPFIFFKELGSSSLNFSVYFTVNDVGKRFSAMSDINSMIISEFRKHGIEIAFPQIDVHMRKEN